MSEQLSDEGVNEVSVVIAVAFCVSIKWDELVQTVYLSFENGRQVSFFVGDKPRLRRMIEQAAAMRGLTIRKV